MEKRRLVIAIAAVSGGGKTTIVRKLLEELPHSKALFFDDYDFNGPKDIIEWVDNSGNPNEWDLTPFITDIKKSLAELPQYIFLDYPFAYLHHKVGEFIDFAVFIDTPLDIALARRIIRDYKSSSTNHIMLELENYLLRGRRGYLHMLETTKKNSDLIVDGSLSIQEIINVIIQSIVKLEKS